MYAFHVESHVVSFLCQRLSFSAKQLAIPVLQAPVLLDPERAYLFTCLFDLCPTFLPQHKDLKAANSQNKIQ